MKFNQENNKLKKIFDSLKKNRNSLDQKKNESIILNFFKENLNNPIIFDISDAIPKAVSLNDSTTIVRGTKLPVGLSIDIDETVDIPDEFVPYLEPLVFIEPIPNTELLAFATYTSSFFTNSYIEVRGDGTLIYKGVFPLNSDNLISQTQVDNNDVQESFTKKVWDTIILYTNTDEFSLSGEVIGIQTIENSETCDLDPGTANISDFFNVRPFMSAFPDYHKITALDETGFTGIGDYIDNFFSVGTPTCTEDETNIDEVELSRTFSGVEDYVIYVQGIKTNITQSTVESGLFEVLGSQITSKEFTFQGYRLYYSDLTEHGTEFDIADVGLELQNLPTSPQNTLVYSSITLQSNPGSFPNKSTNNWRETTQFFFVPAIGELTTGNIIRKDINVLKIHENRYRYLMTLGLTYLVPANTENPNTVTQNDTYTVVGLTYDRTTNNVGTKSGIDWTVESTDFKYRIVWLIRNPLSFEEIRKYDTSQ